LEESTPVLRLGTTLFGKRDSIENVLSSNTIIPRERPD
jgi:hypothetical protein